ncbi:MAG: RNA-binding protein [Sphingobacteriales bacterium]|nr:MAG: RNA-binding protein [Sphingobacteriales bacterium]
MDLYIGNLCKQAMDTDLKKAFSAFGNVMSAHIVTDSYTRRSRGFAFVKMEDRISGERAILKLDRAIFMTQTLIVREASNKESLQLSGGFNKV